MAARGKGEQMTTAARATDNDLALSPRAIGGWVTKKLLTHRKQDGGGYHARNWFEKQDGDDQIEGKGE